MIEDDSAVQQLIDTVLRRHGFSVLLAGTGRAGLRQVHEHRPGVVVLDVGLPDLDGWQVLERIRDISEVPVLMLTGYAEEPDKVRGLRAGADDYLTKPFGLDEFTARLEALLRRGSWAAGEAADMFIDGDLCVDFGRRTVTLGGELVAVTPIEFKLLAALVRHPGQVLSAEQLIEHCWGHEAGVSRDQVKLYVSYVRKKLGQNNDGWQPIETVRGFGYRYVPPSD